ncbi:MAG TPA: alpha/beta hydrolase [Marmoricola sp.]|nr:alpha/beta hydrolase [Marmoricola sp.]
MSGVGSRTRRELHRVTVRGASTRPALVLLHGYGCDQTMWDRLLPFLEDDHLIVTYDQAGCGAAGREAYDPVRHASLTGYAEDLIAICDELGFDEVVVVGHSAAAMMGVLAHLKAPDLVAGLVMVAPTPRFVDEPPYVGGFSRQQIDDLLAGITVDFGRWARTVAPAFLDHAEHPDVAAELTAALLRMDPDIAADFARVAFLSDTRRELPAIECPTLVIQATHDPLVPGQVGEFVHDQVPGSSYTTVESHGHFPHATDPERTATAIKRFLGPIDSFLRRTRG